MNMLAYYFIIVIVRAELIFVQEVFRHGARYPIHSQYDNIDYAIQDKLLGELTNVGRRMHYLLGKTIRTEYLNNLKLLTEFDSKFVFVKSTDQNRTIESALSHLQGLFSDNVALSINQSQLPYSVPAWNRQIEVQDGDIYTSVPGFKSIPIHIQRRGANLMYVGDFLEASTNQNCPSQTLWKIQNAQSKIYKQVLDLPVIQDLMAQLQTRYNVTSELTLEDVAKIYSNYLCGIYSGYVQPDLLFDNYRREFEFLSAFTLYALEFYTDLQITSTATPFINATLNNMQRIIQDPQSQRLIIYSAHDHTVANYLAAFKLSNAQCILETYLNNTVSSCISNHPQFASNLIIQLHQNNNVFEVKIRYNGQYKNIPFCNYKLTCQFQVFKAKLEGLINNNYLSDCGIAHIPQQQQINSILTLVITILSSMLVIAGGFQIYKFGIKKNVHVQNVQSLLTNSQNL